MWYLQITDDIGNTLVALAEKGQDSSPVPEKAVQMAQSMCHSMNLAVKHSLNEEALIVTPAFVCGLRNFFFARQGLYIACFYQKPNGADEAKGLMEMVLRHILQSIYGCLVMILGVRSIFEPEENLGKKLKVNSCSFLYFTIKEAIFLFFTMILRGLGFYWWVLSCLSNIFTEIL